MNFIRFHFSYVLLYSKGYQDSDRGESTILIKIQGISSTLHRADLPADYNRVWDEPNYSVTQLVRLYSQLIIIITLKLFFLCKS